jgi:hypothetical protein
MKLFTYKAVSSSREYLYALMSLLFLSLFSIALYAQKVDFSQAANNVKNGDGLGRVDWINGDLNGQNSVYAEGLSVPQRIILSDLTGTSHSLTFKFKVSETPGFGYDFITSWEEAIADANGKLAGLDLSVGPVNGTDRFRDIDNNLALSITDYGFLHDALANHKVVSVPAFSLLGNATADFVTALNTRVANYGHLLSLDIFALGGFAADPVLTFDGFEGQGGGGKLAVMTISWESSAPLVSIEFAGHLAVSDNGVTPANGASSMHGSSYHVKLGALDGNNFSSGRDNQIRVVQATTSCLPPDVDPPTPPYLCDRGDGKAEFPIPILNVPPGATVHWFSDIDLTDPITTPTYVAADGKMIYALVTDLSGCYTVVSLTLHVNPLPTLCTITSNPSCAQSRTGTGSISLAGSFTGISYQLTNCSGSPIGTAVAGTGSDCTTGPLTWSALAAGCYRIVATNTSTNCSRTSLDITVGSAQCVTTYTKGFWGSPGKEKCATNPRTAIDILRSMYPGTTTISFGASPYRFDLLASRDFYSQTDATCKPAQSYVPIQKMLPGGSTPDVLRNPTIANWGNHSTWSYSTYTLLGTDCKGNTYSSIMNNLLAQTIALKFNLSYDPNLAGIHLTGTCLTFNYLDCSDVIGSASSMQSIPASVLTALGANNTINDLYNLANQVLGQGVLTPSPADMTAALNAINVGFDGGKALVSQDNSCSSPTITERDRSLFQTESELSVSAYPNPYSSRVNFTISSPVAGKASLQVYNALGQNVRTVFSGYLQAGQKQTVSFNVPAAMQSILFYKLQVGDRQAKGKVLQAKTE